MIDPHEKEYWATVLWNLEELWLTDPPEMGEER